MVDLRRARELWLSEKPLYRALCQKMAEKLESELRGAGVYAQVSSRPKETTSLLKKLIRKGYAYERVTDKAGARVVVRFQNEVPTVLEVIEQSFEVLLREDKAEALGHNQVGYQGVHYDVRLKADELQADDARLRDLQCEIQVHTLCQNLWAVMDHELCYKPVLPPPEDIKRQIYLLNALLELADRGFTAIRAGIVGLAGAYAMGLLQILERHFYRLVGEVYDPELSYQLLEHLKPLYKKDELGQVPTLIDRFVEANASKLQVIFDQYRDAEDRPLFLFQPEALLILERLERDPHLLEQAWVQRYPHDELEQLSIAWGTPLD